MKHFLFFIFLLLNIFLFIIYLYDDLFNFNCKNFYMNNPQRIKLIKESFNNSHSVLIDLGKNNRFYLFIKNLFKYILNIILFLLIFNIIIGRNL